MQAGEDAQLVKRIQELGDEAAFSRIYRQYSPLVLGVAFRMLKDQGEAEEILQQVFMHLWDRAGDFDPARGRLPVWLAVLTRSRCLGKFRSRQRRRSHEGSFAQMPEWQRRTEAGALDAMEWQEKRGFLIEALAKLKPVQAEVIKAAYFEDLGREEIAKRMRMPLGTVKTHLRRGLIKMLEFLKSEKKDPG